MKYTCNLCNYETDRKNNYEKHEKREKHINLVKDIKIERVKTQSFACKNCEAKFEYASGLSRHKHKCKNKKDVTDTITELKLKSTGGENF